MNYKIEFIYCVAMLSFLAIVIIYFYFKNKELQSDLLRADKLHKKEIDLLNEKIEHFKIDITQLNKTNNLYLSKIPIDELGKIKNDNEKDNDKLKQELRLNLKKVKDKNGLVALGCFTFLASLLVVAARD